MDFIFPNKLFEHSIFIFKNVICADCDCDTTDIMMLYQVFVIMFSPLVSFQTSKSNLNIDSVFKHGRPLSKIPSLGRRNFQFPRQSKFFKLPNIKQVIGQLCGTGKVFSN